jgi:hypothetical protein
VFGFGFSDGTGDAQPITHVGNFSERHAGLGHAVGTGIHAEEEDLLFPAAEFFQIVAMPFPGVFERVVGASHGLGEGEPAKLFAEIVGGFDKGSHGAVLQAEEVGHQIFLYPCGQFELKDDVKELAAIVKGGAVAWMRELKVPSKPSNKS